MKDWDKKYLPSENDYQRRSTFKVQRINDSCTFVMKIVMGEEYETYLKIKTMFEQSEKEKNFIIPILDAGYFSFMKDYVVVPQASYSLAEYLANDNFEIFLDDIQICLQITQSLCQLHDLDIIHCDLRPENIFYFKEENRLKIGNFSKAKILHTNNFNPNNSSQRIEYLYQAPEVVRSLSFSKSSDVFSLGLLIFKILSREDVTIDQRSFGTILFMDKLDPKVNAKIDGIIHENIRKLLSTILIADTDKRPKVKDIEKLLYFLNMCMVDEDFDEPYNFPAIDCFIDDPILNVNDTASTPQVRNKKKTAKKWNNVLSDTLSGRLYLRNNSQSPVVVTINIYLQEDKEESLCGRINLEAETEGLYSLNEVLNLTNLQNYFDVNDKKVLIQFQNSNQRFTLAGNKHRIRNSTAPNMFVINDDKTVMTESMPAYTNKLCGFSKINYEVVNATLL